MLFHFLTQGSCRVRLVDGGDVIDVTAGDLILFPQDDRHLMGSDLHLAPLEADNLTDAAAASAAEQPWTVEELAREVGASRSSLATRFAMLVGESPMQYLMRWRLALAARALRSGSDAISRVAERSGYETEAAFSRAFKREFGQPPSAWRKVTP